MNNVSSYVLDIEVLHEISVEIEDADKMDTCSPAKRFNCGWITPEKLHLNRPLLLK